MKGGFTEGVGAVVVQKESYCGGGCNKSPNILILIVGK